MIKIKLSIENLTVESFATSAAGRDRGTVLGHAESRDICLIASGQDAPECGTAYPACPSINDGCASSPHSMTLPCNGCVETDHVCVIDGGELG
jgi:hypothetical protein